MCCTRLHIKSDGSSHVNCKKEPLFRERTLNPAYFPTSVHPANRCHNTISIIVRLSVLENTKNCRTQISDAVRQSHKHFLKRGLKKETEAMFHFHFTYNFKLGLSS